MSFIPLIRYRNLEDVVPLYRRLSGKIVRGYMLLVLLYGYGRVIDEDLGVGGEDVGEWRCGFCFRLG